MQRPVSRRVRGSYLLRAQNPEWGGPRPGGARKDLEERKTELPQVGDPDLGSRVGLTGSDLGQGEQQVTWGRVCRPFPRRGYGLQALTGGGV